VGRDILGLKYNQCGVSLVVVMFCYTVLVH